MKGAVQCVKAAPNWLVVFELLPELAEVRQKKAIQRKPPASLSTKALGEREIFIRPLHVACSNAVFTPNANNRCPRYY